MDADSKKNYIDYVTNVLGIRSIIAESVESSLEQVEHTQTANSLSSKLNSISFLFVVENLNTYQSEEAELLNKIVASVKLPPDAFRLVDLQNVEHYERAFTIWMVDHPELYQQKLPNKNQTRSETDLVVFSARILNVKPELKKQVWNDLQKVIQYQKKNF